MSLLGHYQVIAGIFDYPDASYPSKVEKALRFLQGYCPEAAAELVPFREGLPKDDLEQMRELFTRSFDVQAITTLDVGYVLFGDDYKRGELLANLSREHRQAANDCGQELADHLPNILRLVPKLADQELLTDLIQQIIAPALKRMLAEFDPRRIEQRNELYKKHYRTVIESSVDKATIYRHALAALDLVLQKDFPSARVIPAADEGRGFLGAIGTEMVVEEVARD